ncbi:proline--tRNA ligase [Candidatus Micrarchaeota archaeon]|nr:proline--tRNA ligase [Candidatus Micrarchaeota archaeon]
MVLGMKFDKNNFSEWFGKVLEEADVIDLRYPVKGMPIYKAWGFSILRNCFKMLEGELNASSHQEMLFPLLIPEDQFAREGEHIKGFEAEVLWATHSGLEKMDRKLAVRPTSETVMYPMFALWVRTHADLPLRVHQTCCVYRQDTKMTRPLIRGREIYWNEAHCAHATAEDAESQVKKALEIYGDFYKKLCVPFKALKRPDFDKFPGAEYSIALDVVMPDGRVLQAATAHNLGQNFSKVYGITFDDEKGAKQHAFQTTYGVSMRCLAVVVALHGDDKGLVLPPAIAPVQVIIIPILSKDEKQPVLEKCRQIKKQLIAEGVRVDIDERETRPGDKYYYWEARGVPVRIELGPRDLQNGQAVIATRLGEKKQVKQEQVVEETRKALAQTEKKLFENASEKLGQQTSKATTLEQLKQTIEEKGGFAKAGWCGSQECAETIEKQTTAEIRGKEKEEKAKCIACGKQGSTVYIAKAY